MARNEETAQEKWKKRRTTFANKMRDRTQKINAERKMDQGENRKNNFSFASPFPLFVLLCRCRNESGMKSLWKVATKLETINERASICHFMLTDDNRSSEMNASMPKLHCRFWFPSIFDIFFGSFFPFFESLLFQPLYDGRTTLWKETEIDRNGWEASVEWFYDELVSAHSRKHENKSW